MAEIIIDKTIENEKGKIKELIGEAHPKTTGLKPKVLPNLYETVFSDLCNSTIPSTEQVGLMEIYQTALGVFKATADAMRLEMDTQTLDTKLQAFIEAEIGRHPENETEIREGKGGNGELSALTSQLNDALFFGNRYALYFAGQVGLASLGSVKIDSKKRFTFGSKYDASKDSEELVRMLATTAVNDLKRTIEAAEKNIDEQFKSALECIFTTWVNQFNWYTHKDVAKARSVEELSLKYKTFSVKDGEFKRKFDTVEIDSMFMPVRKEDVIGTQELGAKLWRNLLKLGCYDVERAKNPMDPAFCIFTYGEPGGGKTYTAHAMIQSFGDLCRKLKIPFWGLTHSSTSYATAFQNETANALDRLAGEIRKFQGIVVMYVADADTILVSRKDPDLRMEQKQTLSVYNKMFDGTLIPKNGKFMVVMDANELDGIDDATKSRLFDEVIHHKRYDKAEDFAALVKLLVAKGSKDEILSKEDWQEIGRYVLETPLSNREITSICRAIRGEYEVAEDMLTRTFDEKLAYRNDHIKGLISKPNIISQVDFYIRNRMEIERKAYEAKKADDSTRFLEYLLKKKDPSVKDILDSLGPESPGGVPQ